MTLDDEINNFRLLTQIINMKKTYINIFQDEMILKNLHEDLSGCLDKIERWLQWDLKKL